MITVTSGRETSQARDLSTVAVIGVQLLAVTLVIYQFQLESRAFFNVMLLASGGFIVHALLPLERRLTFFTVLSLVAIVVAFGPLDGLSLVALGLVLIGICHLHVRLVAKVVLLLAAGALFALWRVELLPAPWSAAIWPILASMFMFRLALYLYTLHHDPKRPTWAQTLAYFFMLPNVCFPLYPVVDYSTFVRTYYDREARLIYTTGMQWIVRGLIHLLLYRFVYLNMPGDTASVTSLGDLLYFTLATFLLYLRVSGQFHLIVGVLHLYGFRLPETHHLYYLANGFTDFWRRINIYWKDFMMKLVYYPSFFFVRRWGNNLALISATVIVFLSTWLLHSYQWFWLRGGFPLEPQDALFWGILCVLVVFGALREMNHPKKRAPGRGPAWSAARAVRTLGTFTAICFLWSLWSAEALGEWLVMWEAAANVTSQDLWLLAAVLAGGLLIAGWDWSARQPEGSRPRPFYRQPAFQSTAALSVISLLGYTEWYAQRSPVLAASVASLQAPTLNARDKALQHKGYYEKLDNVREASAQLWSVQSQKPAHWVGLSRTDAYRVRNDFLRGDLRPNAEITFEDQPLSTNRWGMRDVDIALEKSPATVRIAVLGPSHVMGSGVADGETFADVLERRMNRTDARVRYEVLNFGLAGCSLLHQLVILEDRVVRFQPDIVFVVDSPVYKTVVIEHLINVISNRIAIPFAELQEVLHPAGVTLMARPGLPVPFDAPRAWLEALGVETRMPASEAVRRLRTRADDIIGWTLRRMATVARQHGAVPVFVGLDNVIDPPDERLAVLNDAEAAGFVVFDLMKMWIDVDKTSLRIGDWDGHPNASGHRLIADRLLELIEEHKSALRLPDRPAVESFDNASGRGAPLTDAVEAAGN